MSLKSFMEDAYQGKARAKRLESRRGDMVFSLEDLANRVGTRPARSEVEALAPSDEKLLGQLLAPEPDKMCQVLWGFLSSIAAERSPVPLRLPPGILPGWNCVRAPLSWKRPKITWASG